MKFYQVDYLNSEQQTREFVTQYDRALETTMERIALEIAETPQLRFLGLTGPTCSGKTTAATHLSDCLAAHGYRIHMISIDDFYHDKSFLQARADADPNIEVDYDSEDTIDVDLLAKKVESLLACRETRMPRFDFHSGMRTDGVVLCPTPSDIFLFEGIQILYPKISSILSSVPYRSLYICPSSGIAVGGERFEPNEIRLLRRLVRDSRYRSTSPEDTMYLWQSVRANEEVNIFPHAHRCNHVIDSTMPYEIGMLKPYLCDCLQKVPRDNRFAPDAERILAKLRAVQVIPSGFLTPNSLYKEFI